MRLKHLLAPLPSAGASALITLLFALFFVGLIWYVFRKDRKALYQELENMPLRREGNDD